MGAGAARTLISRIQCGTAPVRAALGKQSPLSVILIRLPRDGMIHSVRLPPTTSGRVVVNLLVGAGVPVRALRHRPEAAALPADVDVVTGDSMTAWAAFSLPG